MGFTRDELLDIRKYTPPDISLELDYSDVLLAEQRCCLDNTGCADGGSEAVCTWNFTGGDEERRYLASI